jgi:2-phospho-L-lactate guanylyltransferase
VLARSPSGLRPSFGPDSARRHAAAGIAELPGEDLGSLRLDVDTADDLSRARRLGVGPHTTRLLAQLG